MDPFRAISLGVLHCDPHPGNLLRTTDGKLCILDWGMTLEVPSNLQYALLEFIAHLNVEDYDAVLLGTGGGGEQPSVKDRTPRPTPKQVPQDFINLGFSPEGCACFHIWGLTEHMDRGPPTLGVCEEPSEPTLPSRSICLFSACRIPHDTRLTQKHNPGPRSHARTVENGQTEID